MGQEADPAEEVRATLAGAQQKLFAAREKRVRPGRDEKILTSWNALMIKGMACAGRLLQRPDLIDSAEKALDYIREGWMDAPLMVAEGAPPRKPVATWDELKQELDADREER